MTNFDIFTYDPRFASFAETAGLAERIYQIDPAACVLNCHRAMEITDLVAQATNPNLSFKSPLTKHGFCLTA